MAEKNKLPSVLQILEMIYAINSIKNGIKGFINQVNEFIDIDKVK